MLVWSVCCDSKNWFTLCHCYRSGVCNIVINWMVLSWHLALFLHWGLSLSMILQISFLKFPYVYVSHCTLICYIALNKIDLVKLGWKVTPEVIYIYIYVYIQSIQLPYDIYRERYSIYYIFATLVHRNTNQLCRDTLKNTVVICKEFYKDTFPWWCHMASLNFVQIGLGNGLLPDSTNPSPWFLIYDFL